MTDNPLGATNGNRDHLQLLRYSYFFKFLKRVERVDAAEAISLAFDTVLAPALEDAILVIASVAADLAALLAARMIARAATAKIFNAFIFNILNIIYLTNA